jgi:hypothetical protein
MFKQNTLSLNISPSLPTALGVEVHLVEELTVKVRINIKQTKSMKFRFSTRLVIVTEIGIRK